MNLILFMNRVLANIKLIFKLFSISKPVFLPKKLILTPCSQLIFSSFHMKITSIHSVLHLSCAHITTP
jgi:hypothetical protein